MFNTNRTRKAQKWAALFTAVVFGSSEAALALPLPVAEIWTHSFPVHISPPFEIPGDLATIKESFGTFSPAAPVFFYIEDAHANYEAQVKTKEMLRWLYEKHGVDLAFVEGAASRLDPDRLRFFPKEDHNRQIADEMAKLGEVTGAELFLLEATKDYKAVGIESHELYKKSLVDFHRVLDARPKIENFLAGLNRQINAVEEHLLNPRLRDFLQTYRSFREDQLDLIDYLKRLKAAAGDRLGLDLLDVYEQIDWPQLVRLSLIEEMDGERRPGPEGRDADEETTAFLDQLHELRISKYLIDKIASCVGTPFTAWSSAGRALGPAVPGGRPGTAPAAHGAVRLLFERLYAEAVPKGLRFDDYPALQKKMALAILRDEIDAETLGREVDRLTQTLLDALAENEKEKEWLNLDRDVQLLRQALLLELTPEQFESMVNRFGEIAPGNILRRLDQFATAGSVVGAPFGQAPVGRSIGRHRRLVGRRSGAWSSGTERSVRRAVGAAGFLRPAYDIAVSNENGRGDRAPTHDVHITQNLFRSAIRFYTGSCLRDTALVENSLAQLKIHGKSRAVIIAGGFHTPRVTELLRAKGASFLVLTPKLTSVDKDRSLYYQAMSKSVPTMFSVIPSPLDQPARGRQAYEVTSNIVGPPVLQENFDSMLDNISGTKTHLTQIYLTLVRNAGWPLGDLFEFRSGNRFLKSRARIIPIGRDDESIPRAVAFDDGTGQRVMVLVEKITQPNGMEFSRLSNKTVGAARRYSRDNRIPYASDPTTPREKPIKVPIPKTVPKRKEPRPVPTPTPKPAPAVPTPKREPVPAGFGVQHPGEMTETDMSEIQMTIDQYVGREKDYVRKHLSRAAIALNRLKDLSVMEKKEVLLYIAVQLREAAGDAYRDTNAILDAVETVEGFTDQDKKKILMHIADFARKGARYDNWAYSHLPDAMRRLKGLQDLTDSGKRELAKHILTSPFLLAIVEFDTMPTFLTHFSQTPKDLSIEKRFEETLRRVQTNISLGGKVRYGRGNLPLVATNDLAEVAGDIILKKEAFSKEDPTELQLAVGGIKSQRARYIALGLFIASTDHNYFRAVKNSFQSVKNSPGRDPGSPKGILIAGTEYGTFGHLAFTETPYARMDYLIPYPRGEFQDRVKLVHLLRFVKNLTHGLYLAEVLQQKKRKALSPEEIAIANVYIGYERELVRILRKYDRYRDNSKILRIDAHDEDRLHALESYKLEESLWPQRNWLVDLNTYKGDDKDWNEIVPSLRRVEDVLLSLEPFEDSDTPVASQFLFDVRNLVFESASAIDDIQQGRAAPEENIRLVPGNDPLLDESDLENTRYYAARTAQDVQEGFLSIGRVPNLPGVEYYSGVKLSGFGTEIKLGELDNEWVRKVLFPRLEGLDFSTPEAAERSIKAVWKLQRHISGGSMKWSIVRSFPLSNPLSAKSLFLNLLLVRLLDNALPKNILSQLKGVVGESDKVNIGIRLDQLARALRNIKNKGAKSEPKPEPIKNWPDRARRMKSAVTETIQELKELAVTTSGFGTAVPVAEIEYVKHGDTSYAFLIHPETGEKLFPIAIDLSVAVHGSMAAVRQMYEQLWDERSSRKPSARRHRIKDLADLTFTVVNGVSHAVHKQTREEESHTFPPFETLDRLAAFVDSSFSKVQKDQMIGFFNSVKERMARMAGDHFGIHVLDKFGTVYEAGSLLFFSAIMMDMAASIAKDSRVPVVIVAEDVPAFRLRIADGNEFLVFSAWEIIRAWGASKPPGHGFGAAAELEYVKYGDTPWEIMRAFFAGGQSEPGHGFGLTASDDRDRIDVEKPTALSAFMLVINDEVEYMTGPLNVSNPVKDFMKTTWLANSIRLPGSRIPDGALLKATWRFKVEPRGAVHRKPAFERQVVTTHVPGGSKPQSDEEWNKLISDVYVTNEEKLHIKTRKKTFWLERIEIVLPGYAAEKPLEAGDINAGNVQDGFAGFGASALGRALERTRRILNADEYHEGFQVLEHVDVSHVGIISAVEKMDNVYVSDPRAKAAALLRKTSRELIDIVERLKRVSKFHVELYQLSDARASFIKRLSSLYGEFYDSARELQEYLSNQNRADFLQKPIKPIDTWGVENLPGFTKDLATVSLYLGHVVLPVLILGLTVREVTNILRLVASEASGAHLEPISFETSMVVLKRGRPSGRFFRDFSRGIRRRFEEKGVFIPETLEHEIAQHKTLADVLNWILNNSGLDDGQGFGSGEGAIDWAALGWPVSEGLVDFINHYGSLRFTPHYGGFPPKVVASDVPELVKYYYAQGGINVVFQEGGILLWGLEHAYDSKVKLTSDERDWFAQVLLAWLDGATQGSWMSYKPQQDTGWYLLLRLMIMESAWRRQKVGKKQERLHEKRLRLVRGAYLLILDNLEGMFTGGYLQVDPKDLFDRRMIELGRAQDSLDPVIRQVRDLWEDKAGSRDLVAEIRSGYVSAIEGESSQLSRDLQEAFSDVSLNMRTYVMQRDLAEKGPTRIIQEAREKREKLNKRLSDLKHTMTPKNTETNEAWNEPVRFLTRITRDAEIVFFRTNRNDHDFSSGRLPKDWAFQLAWLEEMAEHGFRSWAFTDPEPYLLPIVGALQPREQREGLDEIYGLINEYLKTADVVPIQSFLGVSLRPNEVRHMAAYRFWERLKEIKNEFGVDVWLMRSPPAGELVMSDEEAWMESRVQFEKWRDEKDSKRRLIFGPLSDSDNHQEQLYDHRLRMEHLLLGTLIKRDHRDPRIVQLEHMTGLDEYKGKEMSVIPALRFSAQQIGNVRGWGDYHSAAVPVRQNEELVGFFKRRSFGPNNVENAFDFVSYHGESLGAFVVTDASDDDDKGHEAVPDGTEPAAADDFNGPTIEATPSRQVFSSARGFGISGDDAVDRAFGRRHEGYLSLERAMAAGFGIAEVAAKTAPIEFDRDTAREVVQRLEPREEISAARARNVLDALEDFSPQEILDIVGAPFMAPDAPGAMNRALTIISYREPIISIVSPKGISEEFVPELGRIYDTARDYLVIPSGDVVKEEDSGTVLALKKLFAFERVIMADRRITAERILEDVAQVRLPIGGVIGKNSKILSTDGLSAVVQLTDDGQIKLSGASEAERKEIQARLRLEFERWVRLLTIARFQGASALVQQIEDALGLKAIESGLWKTDTISLVKALERVVEAMRGQAMAEASA